MGLTVGVGGAGEKKNWEKIGDKQWGVHVQGWGCCQTPRGPVKTWRPGGPEELGLSQCLLCYDRIVIIRTRAHHQFG